jgi:hypothetical protein
MGFEPVTFASVTACSRSSTKRTPGSASTRITADRATTLVISLSRRCCAIRVARRRWASGSGINGRWACSNEDGSAWPARGRLVPRRRGCGVVSTTCLRAGPVRARGSPRARLLRVRSRPRRPRRGSVLAHALRAHPANPNAPRTCRRLRRCSSHLGRWCWTRSRPEHWLR